MLNLSCDSLEFVGRLHGIKLKNIFTFNKLTENVNIYCFILVFDVHVSTDTPVLQQGQRVRVHVS